MDQQGAAPCLLACKASVLLLSLQARMKTIEKKCTQCDRSISVRLVDHNRGHGKFCSRECSRRSQLGQIRKLSEPNCSCASCGKAFYRTLSKKRNSKSGLQFCDRHCKEQAQKLGGLRSIQPPHYGSGAVDYRKLAFDAYPHQCSRCGYSKCLTALEVHHKDRDRSNNALANLEILCRNCHCEVHHLV